MRLTFYSSARRREQTNDMDFDRFFIRKFPREESANPDDSPLPPAAQQSQALPQSSDTSPSTASSTDSAYKPTALSPEATVGIVIIIALVLIFSLAGVAVICGLRGERCYCRRRRARKEAKRETIVRFNVSDHSLPVKESREILIPPSQAHIP